MDSGAYLIAAIALPLLFSPVLAWAGRFLGRKVGWFALIFPVLSCGSLVLLMSQQEARGSLVIEWPWIPSLGIQLSFLIDGLSLFFALIVSGVGVLVTLYAAQYLDDHYKHHGRFYCYLMLFMASMLGTVLSNNLMLLFIFWELTGISSFLLIGFLHEKEESRVGARQALLITGFTGLLLMVGVIMTGQSGGDFRLSELMDIGLPLEEHKVWLSVAMVLMLLGAFGKSAQFPLHFWLPNAMAAPTPVSAYLHSATMVKLGVFLCARIYPLFSELELWGPIVSAVGFFSMFFAGFLMLMAHDLKAMLAFSTISQLGFLIGIYGLGAGEGVRFDFLHIFNHVLYKGSLFMVAGIIDHSTGTRDIRKLGGLRAQMPLLAVIACVSCAAMAGLPGTTGFLSKETILAALLGMTGAPGLGAWLILFAVAFVAVLKVIFGLRFTYRIFFGRNTPGLTDHLHAPSFGLQLPPLILAGMALVFGIFPGLMQQAFDFLAVTGLHAATTEKLVLWHGVTPALIISIIVVLSGCAAWWTAEKRGWFALTIPRWIRFDQFFEGGLSLFSKGTKTITKALRADAPLDYLPIVLGFSVALIGGYMFWSFGAPWSQWVHWSEAQVGPLRSFVAALIALSVAGVLVLRRWTTQLIVLSVAGFLTAFYFVLYHAPDLALTQLLIEAVTLLLILLLLGRFPKSAERGERTRPPSAMRTAMNIALSVGVGAIMTVFVLTITGRPHPDPIGPYFLENTVELAEGSNAVNTILVDFRGIDTLGEITVLVIAMLGCLGLLMRYKRTPEEYRQGSLGPAGSGGPHKKS